MPSKPRVTVRCRAFILTVVLVMLGGCYQHVVSSRGPGAARQNVYEANVDESKRVPLVDDLADAVNPPKSGRQ